jgi:broad specificity polyphosphatase/5'/3'-nucleotidase SurE
VIAATIASAAAVPVLHAESESPSPAPCGTGSLEILLTNDDGENVGSLLALSGTVGAALVSSTRSWFCNGGRLARRTTVLNLNYPARPMSAIRGVAVARQGRTTGLHVTFAPSGADAYASRRVDSAPGVDYPDSDTILLQQGCVTVTPISAVLDERDVPLQELKRRLDTLKP